MPGIVGFITRMPRDLAEPQLSRMVKVISHESFYRTGTWIDESLGVYLGWTARESSFAANMPLQCNASGISMVFSGEEFSRPEAQLIEEGSFESSNSYLVRAYRDDRSFPLTLNGRFHGAAANPMRGEVMLFNDRYGMHRIYYHEAEDAFYFAVEAKAILAVRPELRRANPSSVGEFIACGSVMGNHTLFQGINLLPPGSAWTFRNKAPAERRTYFDPQEWENQERLSAEGYYRALRDVFSQRLSQYFGGCERVAVSLTGGLDSRMIMAWHRAAPDSLPCYTFGSQFRDPEDVVLARKVAQVCHQPFQVFPLGQEFLSRFPHYAERAIYLADGCVQVNQCADLYLNEQARQIAPVRITGNYGSEVLRWAPAFSPKRPLPGLFDSSLIPHIEAAHATYARMRETHPVSFAVFHQAPSHHYGLLSLEESQLSVRSPYLDNDLVRTVFQAPNPAFAERDGANVDLCLRIVGDGNPALSGFRTDRGFGGGDGLSANVTRQLLQFTFKAEYGYDYGMPQWIAKIDHLLSPLHPERVWLGRHKFAHYRVWYRDKLSSYVRDTLLDSKSLSRPYIQRKAVETIVEGHLTGGRNYTTEVHKLLTLEIIHRLFIDENGSTRPTEYRAGSLVAG